jgi:uncharacterized protein
LPDAVGLATANLLTPAILFFALGLLAGFGRSDLSVPEQAAKTLSLYLMLAIGFKGGVEASRAGLSGDFLTAAAAGLILSFGLPVIAYVILKAVARLDRPTIAATAAHYGSVSVVTFAAGSEYLRASGVQFGGYMAAVVALMETPAILTALLLAGGGADRRQGLRPEVLREVLLNGSVVLLVGAFLIGLITGERGMARLETFVGPLFQGALALFLLDMGLVAARRLRGAGVLSPALVAFGCGMPLISCAVAVGLCAVMGVRPADAAMLAVLAASASYIAVPAAMRLALPQADAGVYLTLSLGITFPFNLIVGIPLYGWIVQRTLGA